MTLAILFGSGQRSLADASGRIYGVAVGIVTDNKDPDGKGRVKVRLPAPQDAGRHHFAARTPLRT